MSGVAGTLFDGRTSQARAVTLRWHTIDTVLCVEGDGLALRYPRGQFTVESRLGRGPRFVRFADGARCEIPDSAEADAIIATWAPNRGGSWLHRVETSWPIVAASTVVLGLIAAATIYWGLPAAARRVAFALPAGLTRQLGDQTLEALDRTMLQPSELSRERQAALQEKFKDFLARTGDSASYRIEFRGMKQAGANAFALPSGTIIITDDLVKLAEEDSEIIAVLGHECGHIQFRHTLRAVLQNSAVFVVVALVTGDVSHATAFGGALPTFLLQNRFSREFEREADAYAVEKLRAAGLDPALLARMLERLAEQHGEHNLKLLGYFSTHPPTPERIRAIRGER